MGTDDLNSAASLLLGPFCLANLPLPPGSSLHEFKQSVANFRLASSSSKLCCCCLFDCSCLMCWLLNSSVFIFDGDSQEFHACLAINDECCGVTLSSHSYCIAVGSRRPPTLIVDYETLCVSTHSELASIGCFHAHRGFAPLFNFESRCTCRSYLNTFHSDTQPVFPTHVMNGACYPSGSILDCPVKVFSCSTHSLINACPSSSYFSSILLLLYLSGLNVHSSDSC